MTSPAAQRQWASISIGTSISASKPCGNAQPTVAGGKPVSYWVEASHDTDANLRKQAVFKLGNVGASDPAVVPALIAALKDSDPHVRCEAILALVKCGPDAKEATDVLVELQSKDRVPKVRDYAAKALKKLQADDTSNEGSHP
jgi:hypothetical protein